MQYINFLTAIHPCVVPRRLLAFKDLQVLRLKALSFIFQGVLYPFSCFLCLIL
ncbi:hypothetical protein RchiOBHm_Chr2g0146691 [Rosa chinensis]|uniref:Uncharacterized protein n=1 Tax=Rosa chinensis TaxID=74649 RepID=A0A2P6RTP2_ROSCH|nr:hypothetical protein RchiOBHm_Chr3g0448751 [Rosa chinensis]PRQ49800.1 hypothetical protein RchiOBHm_Chr2g0125931 [Rosa chinensis]PRQ51640.1 hypothetical protein RchiOBHm_Chr2g0146691 [Rosa chinensis]